MEVKRILLSWFPVIGGRSSSNGGRNLVKMGSLLCSDGSSYSNGSFQPYKGMEWTQFECTGSDIAQDAVKKRRCAAKKPYSRSILGATLEVIQKRRAEKTEVHDAAKEASLRIVKRMLFMAVKVLYLQVQSKWR